MTDDPFKQMWSAFLEGWKAPVRQRLTGVRSRPSFWSLKTWREKERDDLRNLADEFRRAYAVSPYTSEDFLGDMAFAITNAVEKRCKRELPIEVLEIVYQAISKIISEELFFKPATPDDDAWLRDLSLKDEADLSCFLRRRLRFLENSDRFAVLASDKLMAVFAGILQSLASDLANPEGSRGQHFKVPLISLLDDPANVIERTISTFFDSDLLEAELLFETREQFRHNLSYASGFDPCCGTPDPCKFTMPTDQWDKSYEELVELYPTQTPFRQFFNADLPFVLPLKARFEHMLVIGGTGHGKSQTLVNMIHGDLLAAPDQRRSVVVIDSQGDMIDQLSRLDLFNPEGTDNLADRFMLIDPGDITRPPALNLFDPGLGRLENYSPRQKELAFNSLVDIYGRFFGALLDTELTTKQLSVFRYLARLMLSIEGATIHTLIELMDDMRPFQSHVEKLDATARQFFEKEFSRPAFNATRQQIKQRLYVVLSIPTFDRLFSAPQSKVDFFEALNSGKLVFVNTSKDLLKSDGTAIFGRFILALIEHAIMERATLAEEQRTPTFIYVDEAQDYFDETIETLLVQGRKYNCGLVLANQNLAQLPTRLRAIVMGNTTIKLAGGITDADARALAADMHTGRDFLMSMRKTEGSTGFALSVRNHTPHSLQVSIPLGALDNEPAMPDAPYEELLERNREAISYQPQEAQADLAEAAHDEAVAGDPSSETLSPDHKAAQQELAALARQRGFAVKLEYVLPDDKRIDLALFGNGQKIAVEISVTNRPDYELSNILKGLGAGFDHVWMLSGEVSHLEAIASLTRQSLSHDDLARVTFGSIDDAKTWLMRFPALDLGKGHVAGYEVETILVPVASPEDSEFRKSQLRHI